MFDHDAPDVVDRRSRDASQQKVPRSLSNTDQLSQLTGDAIVAGIEGVDGDGRLQFWLAAAQPVPLRRMLPALQSMDLEVLHEDTIVCTRPDGSPGYHYDLTLQAGSDAAAGLARHPGEAFPQIRETFHAIWEGRAEADGFNVLIPAAGLSWRQVCVLRSYGRYLRQLPLPYSQSRIQRVLLDNPVATHAMMALFAARFGQTDRLADTTARQNDIIGVERNLIAEIDQVMHIDADRILRAYHGLIAATVRTNAFAFEALSASAPYLVHKLRGRDIDELPQPRPLSEIFVYSPQFEGVHLRFGLVARGGLRWSDRHDDYRTEVLGLVKAQSVKNAMIVPAGAKGVFVVDPASEARAERGPDRTHGLRCYLQFISALLDVVDGTEAGSTARTDGVVCHDGPDPYLVVAADKGTAQFSDAANSVAMKRGYWLGDAFASGGSAGYDHKAMGITARGAWVSGDFHLRELGIDAHTDEYSVIGIGDMSGDVFGNGMLLRRNIKLIAAFDHRQIFLDPQPSISRAYDERRRLFALPRSSWKDYDRSLISDGGGVWPRTAKTIPISAQLRAALDIDASAVSLTPHRLINHILRAPVDVLFNGGIGTYIKASDEPHVDIADKLNDGLRVNADQVRARVIVEGGNLGVSQRGRVEFARLGGYVNTDAIDNAAGVDCSDHEVNIKILLENAVRAQRLTRAKRNTLLAGMTDEVAAHVLANNTAHNRLLADARFNAAQMINVHARMIAALERQRGLDPKREYLPTATEFNELAKKRAELATPQLATLMAHVKLDLKADLLVNDPFDDPHFTTTLHRYFPGVLRRTLSEQIAEHPLRREIIATATVNRVLATAGLTYAFRLAEETGASTSDIVRAHAVACDIFDFDTLWDDIYSAQLPPALTNALVVEGRRLLDRASRWFLLNRPQPLRIGDETSRFGQSVATLRGKLASMLRGNELAAVTRSQRDFTKQGVPPVIARNISESLYAFSLLDITEIARAHGEDATQVAHIYYELSNHLGVDGLLLAVSSLPRANRWHAQARLALREDLYQSLRDLALKVTRHCSMPTDAAGVIEEFKAYNRPQFQRARRTFDDFLQTEQPDMAVLSVASAQLRRLTVSSV